MWGMWLISCLIKDELIHICMIVVGENKIHFIPGMIGPFLGVTLVPQVEVRNIMIPIFHDMMDWEQRKNGNFKQVHKHAHRHTSTDTHVFHTINWEQQRLCKDEVSLVLFVHTGGGWADWQAGQFGFRRERWRELQRTLQFAVRNSSFSLSLPLTPPVSLRFITSVNLFCLSVITEINAQFFCSNAACCVFALLCAARLEPNCLGRTPGMTSLTHKGWYFTDMMVWICKTCN